MKHEEIIESLGLHDEEFVPIFYLGDDFIVNPDEALTTTAREFLKAGALKVAHKHLLIIVEMIELDGTPTDVVFHAQEHRGGSKFTVNVFGKQQGMWGCVFTFSYDYDSLSLIVDRAQEVGNQSIEEGLIMFSRLFMESLLLVNMKSTLKTTSGVTEAQNARRIRKGRKPIRSHTKIRLPKYEYKGASNDDKRKSPIVHWRRGHLRKHPTQHGKFITIDPVIIGLGTPASTKVYKT